MANRPPNSSNAAGSPIGTGTTNVQPGSVVELQGEGFYKVTYQFVAVTRGPHASLAVGATSQDLRGGMLYFRPNSTQLPQGKGRLGHLKDCKYSDGSGTLHAVKANVIEINNVKSGDTVELFFALDALQENRKQPLYKLGPVTCECVVTIFEKPGKLGHLPNLALDYVDEGGVAWYSGVLSGDTWKTCCPPFSAEQAKGILAKAGFSNPVVDAAMQAIYNGDLTLVSAASEYHLDLAVPAAGTTPASTLRLVWHNISWGPSSNPAKNISAFDPKIDVEIRVHPYAYAAVISAALKCEIRAVQFNSSWRPMLAEGTGHRHADSLDVGALTDKDGNVHQFRWDSLASAEQAKLNTLKSAEREEAKCKNDLAKKKKAYDKLKQDDDKQRKKTEQLASQLEAEEAKVEQEKARLAALESQPEAATAKEKAKQKLALGKAKKSLAREEQKLSKLKKDHEAAAKKLKEMDEKLTQAEQEYKTSESAAAKATTDREKASSDWQAVVDSHMPEVISRFRDELFASPLVRQIIDPWAIDLNTRDSYGPSFNERASGLEQAHLNHLHITCAYPELLQF